MMRLLSIIIFLPLIFWGADGPPPHLVERAGPVGAGLEDEARPLGPPGRGVDAKTKLAVGRDPGQPVCPPAHA